MLREFEELLAQGGGKEQLEHLREHLRHLADEDRTKQLSRIEDDYKTAQLILYGISQDRGSPAYAVARGLVSWYKKQHPQESLASEILRDLRRGEYEKRMEAQQND